MNSNSNRTRDWLVAGYRRVLHLGPRPFRQRLGNEMAGALAALLTDTERQAGTAAMLRIWCRGVIDALRTAWREHREESSGSLTPWRGVSSDMRYAVRSWRRNPGFALTAIGTLVLGVGLAVGVFAFADGYLFRGLPFPHAAQLFALRETSGSPGWLRQADVDELRESSVADFGFVDWGVSDRLSARAIVIGERHVSVLPYAVTPGFGQTLKLPLALGRWFTAEDHQPGALIPVWLSHRFWDREFARDRDIVGKRFKVIGGAIGEVVVVGVLAPLVASFDLNNPPPDLIAPDIPTRTTSPNHYSSAIVRVPDGLTQAQAEARLTAAYRALPPPPGAWTRDAVRLKPLENDITEGGRPTAKLLFAGALLILLLVLVNLVFLLLAKGAARAGEIAMRAALGASRWRLSRLFLVESGLLALAGLAGGLGIGRLLAAVIDSRIPVFPTQGRNLAMVPMTFDQRVIVFAVLLGAVVVAVGTVWPTWWATRRSLTQNARTSASVGGALRGRTAKALLASEVAVATVITIGAVFVGLGIWRHLHPALGFEYRDRFWMSIEPRAGTVGAKSEAHVDLTSHLQAIREVPGISSASRSWTSIRATFDIDGRPIGKDTGAYGVREGTLETWGAQVVKGRLFTSDEFRANAPLVVVDQRTAARLWPDREPVGQHLKKTGGAEITVVGVIRNVRRTLRQQTIGAIYLPQPDDSPVQFVLVSAPGMTADGLRERLRSIAAASSAEGFLSVSPVTFQDLFLRESGEAAFQAPFVVVFGGLAFLLVGIGLFGLVSYLVEHRLREFGIRLALGAQARHLRRQVMNQSLVPALIGLAIGIALTWSLEKLMTSQVFGWQGSVPISVALVSTSLLAIAAVAAMVPARRAARVDPVIVLRAD